MRLVTWNCCRGPYAKKVPLVESLHPDIAVMQECAKPAVESDNCLWFGDNPRQGILVRSFGQYSLQALPCRPEVPKFFIPVQVSGPVSFVLFAVWSKANPEYRYIEAVVRAVELYEDIFVSSKVVLMGDLNSNAIWDATHPPELNHSALVRRLGSLGLTSAYHHFYGESHGGESRPTYYFHWNKQKPFHIDYCFMPMSWASNIKYVEIGSYDDWRLHSDHRPLVMELADLG